MKNLELCDLLWGVKLDVLEINRLSRVLELLVAQVRGKLTIIWFMINNLEYMISINMKKGEWKGQRSQTNSDLLLYLPNNYS